jgi:hypothetical protein
MPLNSVEIRNAVKDMVSKAQQREELRVDRIELANALMDQFNQELETLCYRVEKASLLNKYLRCAVPVGEFLCSSFPAPEPPDSCVLLASDGSQIEPSRHEDVDYGLINIGVYRICPGSGTAPTEEIESQLLGSEDLLLTEDEIALKRDLEERRKLAELAGGEEGLVITLTDGPIELYGQPSKLSKPPEEFEEYLGLLSALYKKGAITAGYVDKPRADLVVRLLELMTFDEKDLSEAGKERPLSPVTDADLYYTRLAPGERSPVFAMQSLSARLYEGPLALHFFYLNMGFPGHPWLARVEIPAWVAESPDSVNSLHAVLLSQCAVLNFRPYPYALHRAHEIAVVGKDEKEEVERMIFMEMLRQGVRTEAGSNKQYHKDNSGFRTRYKQ